VQERAYPVGTRWSGRHPADTRPRNFMLARWRWIVAVTFVVVAAAGYFSYSRTPTYKSSADVLVQPRVFAVGTAPQVPDMGSEQAVAESTAVLQLAATALKVPISTLQNGLSVGVPLNTHVLHISYTSSDPAIAQQRAQAVATAYVRYWISQQPPLADGKAAKNGQPVLKSSVISAAKLPSAPASPNHKTDLAIALIVGLALGIGTAYLRDRLDDRLRGASDLEQCSGSAVLAVVPRAGLLARRRSPVLHESYSRGAIVYADLAGYLLRIAAQRPGKTVLVTSPVGDRQLSVSANLAVALADCGKQVILVQADLRRSPGGELFDADPHRGLAAAIDGRIGLTEALQQTPIPGLQVMPAGNAGSHINSALQSPQLRQLIRRLRTSADVVVIDGPPALAGADAAALTDNADLVLVAADGHRTTRAQMRAAARQLRPVHAKIVGSLLDNVRGRPRFTPARAAGGAPRDRLGRRQPDTPFLVGIDGADVDGQNIQHANGWVRSAPSSKR
jgi:capsular exopolysaccharide synthesis family protein